MSEPIEDIIEHDETAEDSDASETHEEIAVDGDNPIAAVVGQFGLNVQTFAAQLINFLIVLVILWRFVYKPVVKLLDERQEKIEKSVKTAEEIEERMTKLSIEREEILNEARKEAQAIAEKAHEDSNGRRDEMVASAKREVERVISKGKDQLATEKASMLRELRKDVVDIAVKAVARVLDDQVDEKRSKSLAEEVVRKMS
ncbi:F0F1 ATP synthase subunit B [Candidatus Uhrbacteria bacterium]|nr:F0F1 ATP synthase subunit B [Candidatus Uhrbacteria bacterium]